MITRIEATNYRCLDKLDVDLSEFAVLVGANGSGKTTLMDIPNLLSDCLKQQSVGQAFTTRINEMPPRCSTLEELTFGKKSNFFILAIEAKIPAHIADLLLPIQPNSVKAGDSTQLHFLRYEIRFEILNKKELTVGTENLFLFSEYKKPERQVARIHGDYKMPKSWRLIISRGSNNPTGFRVETNKQAKNKSLKIAKTLLALPKVKFEAESDFPAASWFYDLLCQRNVFYRPDLKFMQTASVPGLSKKLMPNAENLPWLALELQNNKLRFQMWIDHVRTALPQVKEIRVKEREEDHYAYFIITYNGGYEVTSSGLSEGTLRILSLTILPYLNNLPSIIIIEEPENGIHPRAIESVLQSLSSVYDSQVLVSSHSPVVLAQSRLDQILCACLADNGAASVVSGKEHPQLKEWQGQIDLGALFAAGVLG